MKQYNCDPYTLGIRNDTVHAHLHCIHLLIHITVVISKSYNSYTVIHILLQHGQHHNSDCAED